MRFPVALITTIVLLVSYPASIIAMSPGGVVALRAQAERQARLAGEEQPAPNGPAGQEIFMEGGFVYIPPPPPSDSTDPRFYQQSFHATPQIEPPPPNEPSTATPPQTPTAIPTATLTESPTDIPPAPTATPTPNVTHAVSHPIAAPGPMEQSLAPEPSVPVAFIIATPEADQGQFFDGGFIYIPPGPQTPDNPSFHHGTYTYSQESDKMSRVSESGTVIPLAPGAIVTPMPKAPALAAQFELVAQVAQPQAAAKWLPAPAPIEHKTPDETQTASVSLSPSYYDRSLLPAEGKAMYYNPGVMQEVLEYRLSMGQVDHCPDCVGYVALLRGGDLNRRVWIEWPDGSVEGPFLVIDVAARHHVSMLLGRGWIIDVDYHTAMRHGMNRPLPVVVYDYPPFLQPFTTYQSNTQPQ